MKVSWVPVCTWLAYFSGTEKVSLTGSVLTSLAARLENDR